MSTATIPQAQAGGETPLSPCKQRVMQKHAERQAREMALFQRLCRMRSPTVIHRWNCDHGKGPECLLLRAVEANGREHLFLQRNGDAPSLSPISRFDAIGFVLTGAVPECLFDYAGNLWWVVKLALKQERKTKRAK